MTARQLGATWTPESTNFSIYSNYAELIELCLLTEGTERRIAMSPEQAVWSIEIAGVQPGQYYGYRVHGPYAPELGDRFNPAKLLLDPYTKAVSGKVHWSPAVYGYRPGGRGAPRNEQPDRRDSAGKVPVGVVVDDRFDWQGDKRLEIPMQDSVIYELHTKGFTNLHPDIPDQLRGTYSGLAHPAAIDHFHRLGVTAVELLPVHAFVDDDFLVARGLKNYWGYSSLAFFAPEPRYSISQDASEQIREFKGMVQLLHRAGIEVLLDVVYNHTCEGNHHGPTLSFRGIDNRSYYRLFAGQSSFYQDMTGTGNTVDASNPQSLKLIMDSLRYWVEEMHVDGFRFDLAPTLAREEVGFSQNSAFFRALHQDPVLSQVKLIAEPWDIGDGGYQLGAFPRGWSEWNDRYRNSIRAFWRGDSNTLSEFGFRVCGSADIFNHNHRNSTASVNFITAHDGFTLNDLVSYERKHNAENGEQNRDGSDWNLSANYGVEGPTDDPAILALRHRQRRNLMATLWLSMGVPMIVAGDEMGRTQGGNNNAYCQDNETSWVNWGLAESDLQLLAFTERLSAFRRGHPALRRRSFLSGQRQAAIGMSDIVWHWPVGTPAPLGDWNIESGQSVAYQLSDETGDDVVFVAVNGATEPCAFALPTVPRRFNGKRWRVKFTTDEPTGDPAGIRPQRGKLTVPARTVVALTLD